MPPGRRAEVHVELSPVSEAPPGPGRPAPGRGGTPFPAAGGAVRAGGAALLLLVCLAVAALLAPLAFEGRVMPGVRALGVPLGGLDRAAAGERLRPEVAALLESRPRLTLGDDEVAFPASAFGDPTSLTEDLVARAYARGREGPFAGVRVLAHV